MDLEKFNYDIVYSQYRGHASEIARSSAKENIDVVCAVGGDGTVHEVGTALIGSKTKLAILPAGSGNGLARHLNILHMDTVLVNDKPFLNTGGYGFDALIAKKFDEGKQRGFMAYVKLVVREFFKYNPVNVSVDVNGQVKTMLVVMCSIANASEFGNGFCVSPKSDVTDGKIELVLLKPFRIWALPLLAFQFFRKRAHKSKFAEIISFEKAKIRLSKRMAHYDGEPVDVRNELHVQVVPKSLFILSGKK